MTEQRLPKSVVGGNMTEQQLPMRDLINGPGRLTAFEEPANLWPRSEPEDVGRLSARAMREQYEAAAKAWENMGEEIVERIARIEEFLAEAAEDMKLVAEAAKAIREKGAVVYAQIDEASELSKMLRNMCSEVHKKSNPKGDPT